MRKSLTRNERLRKKKEIAEVIKNSGRIQNSWIVIRYRMNDRVTSRMCVTLRRGFGNAVTRNRYKRLIREIFRQNKHRICGGIDFVFILSPVTKMFSEMQQVVLSLLEGSDLLIAEGETRV